MQQQRTTMKIRFLFLTLSLPLLFAASTHSTYSLETPLPLPTAVIKYEYEFNIPEPEVRYALTEAERTAVEMCVMAESGIEPYEGQVAVAQCLLNLCEARGVRPETIISDCFTPLQAPPSESVKEAVSAVFDNGEVAIEDTPLYFYAPGVCVSDWHESQRYITTIGGHRFFGDLCA